MLEYKSCDNVIIEFVYNDKIISVRANHLKDGSIKNPYKYKDLYEGQVNKTNEGYIIQIIEYISSENITIKFLYNGLVKKTTIQHFKLGQVSNPYHPNQFGAYIGIGEYDYINNKELFNIWTSMFQRTNNISNNAYKNIIICKEWYCFQNYAKWYYSNISKLNKEFEYEIDKDIKQIGKSPKIYSQYTCTLVPKEINRILVGIYKINSKIRNLPIGVHKRNKTYQARFSINGKNINLGNTKTPEEAFEIYHKAKLDYIKERAEWYYKRGGLIKEDYEYIINNFDILPYSN